MEDIKSQFSEIKSIWETVYKDALGKPQQWSPYLPNSSLEMLNEAVGTVSIWIAKSKAPNGHSPGYHLAKSLAAVYFPSLLSSVRELAAGNYNHFQNFVNYLINILAAIHTMVVYAPKNDQESTNADFSAELSQALSLLNTAQKELSEKLRLLEKSQTLSDEIITSYETIKVTEKEIEAYKNQMSDYESQANSFLLNITEHSEKIAQMQQESAQTTASSQKKFESQVNDHNKRYEELIDVHNKEHAKLLSNSLELFSNLEEKNVELSRLQEKCKQQERVIDSILPRGASAGLAAAFSERGKQLEFAKWTWLFLFAISLVGLSLFAWHLIDMPVPEGTTFWNQLLSRLPLAAPLVWLGWFSAIQYGNIIRVQEDYAFKEATSKAFQGYKDHMEHLRNVDLDEGKTALTLLSEATINVLSREPLRIYGKTEQDASPTHVFTGLFRRRKSKAANESNEKND